MTSAHFWLRGILFSQMKFIKGNLWSSKIDFVSKNIFLFTNRLHYCLEHLKTFDPAKIYAGMDHFVRTRVHYCKTCAWNCLSSSTAAKINLYLNTLC